MLVALVSIALVVGPFLVLSRARFAVRTSVTLAGAAVALGALYAVGADLGAAAGRGLDLVAVVGYSALAALVTHSGTLGRVGDRVGVHPVAVFSLAAVVTVFTSNDTVVLALAPLVLAAERPWRAAAALFVGANVSAMLLPQGSPTNVLIQHAAGWDFVSYVGAVWGATLAMVLVALVSVAVMLRGPRHGGGEARLTGDDRMLLGVLVAAAALQPAFEVAGAPRWSLGMVLLGVAAGLARRLGVAWTAVATSTAWVVPVAAMALSAAGGVLAAQAGGLSPWGSAAALFGLSALATDITSAGVGAAFVLQGSLPGAAALVAATAGAFVTPVGSLSGLLLWQQFSLEKVRVRPVVLVVPGLVAILAWAVGTAITL